MREEEYDRVGRRVVQFLLSNGLLGALAGTSVTDLCDEVGDRVMGVLYGIVRRLFVLFFKFRGLFGFDVSMDAVIDVQVRDASRACREGLSFRALVSMREMRNERRLALDGVTQDTGSCRCGFVRCFDG